MATTRTRVPLNARPLDLLYFAFFLIHIPATLLIDLQALYPPTFVPTVLKDLIPRYTKFSGDPLIGGAFSGGQQWVWFKTFLWLELIFQLPVFIWGGRALYRGPPISQRYYPLLLAYSVSSSTTTLACITTVLNDQVITTAQKMLLLGSYVPFFLVPFGMALDMMNRLMARSSPFKKD